MSNLWQFQKGCIPWNKDKVGVYSKKTLSNWSAIRIGRPSYFKNKKHNAKSLKKIRLSLKGRIPWNKGTKGVPWTKARREAQKRIVFKQKKSIIKNGKEYSPLWNDIRKSVYKRDKYRCQECGKHCHNKTKIQCHHIDYDTTNNNLSNLITLCISCHGKTNYKRANWIKYNKQKMEERG